MFTKILLVAEERIQLEDGLIENIRKNEVQNSWKKTDKRVRTHRILRKDQHIEIPESEGREERTEAIFNKIMAAFFQN